jgi:DNA-binding NarL/FixJ family response regulator
MTEPSTAYRRIGTLLVDDEPDIRFLMRLTIEAANAGLCVLGEAADGAQALAVLDDLDPEVVILDQRMPGRTGVETAIEILARRPHQRIIVCSAHLDADLRRSAESAGVLVCLSKSQITEIPDVLRKLMSDS